MRHDWIIIQIIFFLKSKLSVFWIKSNILQRKNRKLKKKLWIKHKMECKEGIKTKSQRKWKLQSKRLTTFEKKSWRKKQRKRKRMKRFIQHSIAFIFVLNLSFKLGFHSQKGILQSFFKNAQFHTNFFFISYAYCLFLLLYNITRI